ncbi:MAG: adenosylcobinamide-GDP ribazoletransferase [Pseudanabaena sp.]|nr:MAG: adenosylcobinamide-GDP ribazoletransferase [Pseudanabaena sp.]
MRLWRKFHAALIFYTCLPVSPKAILDFQGIALFAPLIGIFIGGAIALVDLGLAAIKPSLDFIYLRSLLVILLGLLITGGLHLDGAMDTADGLAVTDPSRRLEVMSDSNTGAFGAIAAIVILLLKIMALAAIRDHRLWILVNVWSWARWGQLRAIMAYPYLKASGKGKFHQADLAHWQVWLVAVLLILMNLAIAWYWQSWTLGISIAITFSISWLTGAWLARQLGGHTGDTYGAIVEWTEALSLCAIAYLP